MIFETKQVKGQLELSWDVLLESCPTELRDEVRKMLTQMYGQLLEVFVQSLTGILASGAMGEILFPLLVKKLIEFNREAQAILAMGQAQAPTTLQ